MPIHPIRTQPIAIPGFNPLKANLNLSILSGVHRCQQMYQRNLNKLRTSHDIDVDYDDQEFLTTALFSGRGGIKMPLHLSKRRSCSQTKSLYRRTTIFSGS